MSRDGYLPDNVTEKDIDALYPEHDPRCPASDDLYSVCKQPECECSILDRIASWWYGDHCIPVEQDCACADLADDDEADKADADEARADSMRMGD